MDIPIHVREAVKNTLHVDIDQDMQALAFITSKARDGSNLSPYDIICAMCHLMHDLTPSVEIAEYLTALHKKGETVEEIAVSAQMLKIFAETIYDDETRAALSSLKLIDCCGTGGGIHTFNISTAVSFILAAAGVPVAKHGNRAITSKSGSADVLEALGVNINVSPAMVGASIVSNNLGFLFAPRFHTATRNVQGVRKTLAHKTIFNILGPLSNPANPAFQLIGVYDAALTERMANVLGRIGIESAMVVHGKGDALNGLDECSTLGATTISRLYDDGTVKTFEITPEQFGLARATPAALAGGTAVENACIIRSVLDGTAKPPQRDIVTLNAGAALTVAGKVNTIEEGIDISCSLIEDGTCTSTLEQFIEFSNKMS